MKSKIKNIHYGWVIVGCGILIMGIAWTVPYNLSTLFITSYAEDMGLSRSAINLAFTIRAMVQLLVSLTAGYVFSKVKLHNLMKMGSISLVLGLFFQSKIQGAMGLYVFTIITSMSALYLTIIPLSIILNNWFNEKLGLVTGLTFMGSGIGTSILSPFVGSWIGLYGWRQTFVILALICGVFLIPIVFFALKTHPSTMGLEAYGSEGKAIEEDGAKKGLSLNRAKKQKSFFPVILSVSIMAFGASTLMQNTSPHLESIGFSLASSAKIFSLASLALAIGKVFLGVLFDIKGVRFASLSAAVALLIGLLSLALVDYSKIFVLGVIGGTGLGCSFYTVANQNLTKNLYGDLDYGSIVAYMQAATSAGAILSPFIVGLAFDYLGSYKLMFLLGAGIVVLAGLIFTSFLPKKNKEPYRQEV